MIEIERLHDLLICDAEHGILYWKYRPQSAFKSWRSYRTFTARFAGKPAGSQTKRGYLEVYLDGKNYKVHRVIWAMTHGHWPDEIDHQAGNKSDNRITALRDVSSTENAKNFPKRKDNTSGVTGVLWSKAAKKWVARICINGKHRQICLTADFDTAVAARKKAEADYGFHPNHGRA
ncbi:HNH endonuclease [Ochrobactrum soli]|uniref:HNH endonuclease n=1 Tax=Ochrobactrum soli TaxID=2448455 RepID=UPI000D68B5F0|nr:HNH endonuclease [[Ochrobactrum] soli]